MSQLMLLTLIAFFNCFISILPPASPTNDKFCVSHSTVPSKVHGTYEYIYWEPDVNASIYYNKNLNEYLFPWIVSETNKRYNIGPDPTENVADSYCRISNPPARYIFNPLDCTQNWNSDPNMRLVKCTDVCVTGSNKKGLHGTYLWSHFNLTTSASIYYCAECNAHSGVSLSALNNIWQTLTDTASIWDVHNGTDGVNIAECTMACKDGIKTPYYGLIGAAAESTHIDIGMVNEIMSWYTYTDDEFPYLEKSIYKFQFGSDEGYTSSLIGSGKPGGAPSTRSCNAVQLAAADYINGYRVIYGALVYGLFFYTANDNVYDCVSNTSNYGSYTDSGIIKFDGYYLSGLYAHAGWVIDALSFQFSSLENCTYNPTINPTVNPTNNPTNNPSNNPTSNSHQVPEVSTINETLLPTDFNDDGENNKNGNDKAKALIIFSVVGVFVILLITTAVVIMLLVVIIKYKTNAIEKDKETQPRSMTPRITPVVTSNIEMNTVMTNKHTFTDGQIQVNIANNKHENGLQPGVMYRSNRTQSIPSISDFSGVNKNKYITGEEDSNSSDDELYDLYHTSNGITSKGAGTVGQN